MRILIYFLLIPAIACNVKECPADFDFSKEEVQLIPYLNDSLLIFQNEAGKLDTFFITAKKKAIVDKGFEIETGSNHWLELRIFYTNGRLKHPEDERQLAWITKGCKSKDFDISANWIDFRDNLLLDRKDYLDKSSYPDTFKLIDVNGRQFFNVLKFQTDTIKWPDAINRDVKAVYWSNPKGVIMYETRSSV